MVDHAPAFGSSPRGRGTRRPGYGAHHRGRFIPARAGNTLAFRVLNSRLPVHPRAGGEHISDRARGVVRIGSSPRGRGTPGRGAGTHRDQRFIPARAGNTLGLNSSGTPITVHPRAGGEHAQSSFAVEVIFGSSLRGRGTPTASRVRRTSRRFIPARAGNTSTNPIPPAPPAVHPRAGGEHPLPPTATHQRSGSSPRGRGTLALRHHQPLPVRFIPARAGNTCASRVPCRRTSVHPRAGGEHLRISRAMSAYIGSSPRGRGTPRVPGLRSRASRFIPARAGNTSSRSFDRRRSTVHPRAGGEHDVDTMRAVRRYGSSPRGRGTPVPARPRWSPLRFIPARAGNTGGTGRGGSP